MLNPRLKDPNHIESGQIIRIPIGQAPSEVTQPVAKQHSEALLSERNTQ